MPMLRSGRDGRVERGRESRAWEFDSRSSLVVEASILGCHCRPRARMSRGTLLASGAARDGAVAKKSWHPATLCGVKRARLDGGAVKVENESLERNLPMNDDAKPPRSAKNGA